MARPEIELPGLIALQPQAAPTDSFVQPAESPLLQFAKDLGRIDRSLMGFLEERQGKADQADKLQGEAAFWASKGEGTAEGVRRGAIPAFKSPAYEAGFKATQGSVAGFSLEQKYAAAYSAWAGKDTPDPNGTNLAKFQQEFVASNIGTKDPKVLAGLLPHIRSLVDAGTTRHVQYQDAKIKQDSINATTARSVQAIDAERSQGVVKPEGPQYQRAFDAYFKLRGEAQARGEDVDVQDRTFMQAVATKATEGSGQAGLLKFFEQKVPGKDYTYGETPDGIKLLEATKDKLEVMARTHDSAEHTRLDREERKAGQEAQSQTVDLLSKDPTAQVPEDILRAARKVDPLFEAKVVELRKTMADSSPTNEQDKQRVYMDILEGGGTQSVYNAAVRGSIRGDEVQKAYTFAKSFEGSKDRIKEATTGQAYGMFAGSIKTRTMDGSFINPVEGMTNAGLAATLDFRRQVAEFVMRNPNAGQIEIDEGINKIGTAILGRLSSAEMGSSATYSRDPALDKQFDNPVMQPSQSAQGGSPAATTQEGATTPAQTPSGAPGGSQGAQGSQTAPTSDIDWFGGLKPTSQAALTDAARKAGVPLGQFLKERRPAYERALNGGAGSPAPSPLAPQVDGEPPESPVGGGGVGYTPISFTPEDATQVLEQGLSNFTEEDATSLLDTVLRGGLPVPQGFGLAALSDDRGAASILDFIGRKEARGNYNAVYGNAASGADLSGLTLDEVLGQQDRAVAAGSPSSAIGRYQFIRGTLRGLKTEMGLTGSERFTPELQDRLGLQLLKRRGLDDWRQGKIDTRTFGRNLAAEWASLPDPNTGRSAYDGDGLNKSSGTVGATLTALEAGRGAGPSPTPLTAPAGDFAGDPYALVPERNDKGEDQRAQFRYWNPDPVRDNEKNLSEIKPDLAAVFRKAAQDNPGLRFVVGSGRRTPEQQKKAMEWGWSQKEDSHHIHGDAVDAWPIDAQGRVHFDPATQRRIGQAMKRAAADLGIAIRWGGDWKKFTDLPHVELVGRNT